MRILALDLGTSSVRGLVLEAGTELLPGALARRRMQVRTAEHGSGTLDGPEYLAGLRACLDELSEAGHLRGVTTVAVCAQWHSVVPLDPRGEPLGPVLTWLDTRPEPAPRAVGPLDPYALHQRTGTWWHRTYWSVRLPWLRERIGGPVARFAGLAEYLLGELLTEAPMSVSEASGTGLLDLRTLHWDPEACELAGVRPGELPDLAGMDWCGRLAPEYATRWPDLARVPWHAPVGDGAASTIGSGCVDPTRAAVTVGTSAAVRLIQAVPVGAPLPPLPDRLWRYRVDHGHVLTGAAYSGGGNLFAWANRVLRLPEGAELEAALARVPPGEPVLVDPRLGGDRPPGRAPAGSGHIGGLSLGTGPVEILAGLLRGLCDQVAEDLGVLESTVESATEVVLGGGAMAASAWWREAFAARLAPRRVLRQPDPEVGAGGAALLALGRLSGAPEPVDIGRTDEPGPPTPSGSAPCAYSS